MPRVTPEPRVLPVLRVIEEMTGHQGPKALQALPELKELLDRQDSLVHRVTRVPQDHRGPMVPLECRVLLVQQEVRGHQVSQEPTDNRVRQDLLVPLDPRELPDSQDQQDLRDNRDHKGSLEWMVYRDLRVLLDQ